MFKLINNKFKNWKQKTRKLKLIISWNRVLLQKKKDKDYQNKKSKSYNKFYK